MVSWQVTVRNDVIIILSRCTHTQTYTHIYTYMFIYVYVCVHIYK